MAKMLSMNTLCDMDSEFENFGNFAGSVGKVIAIISIIIGICIVAVIVGVIIAAIKHRKKISDATSKVGKAITNKLEGLFEEKKEQGVEVCTQCGAKVETVNGKGTCPYCGGKVVTK